MKQILRPWTRSKRDKKRIKAFVKELNGPDGDLVKYKDITIWKYYTPWWALPLELIYRILEKIR